MLHECERHTVHRKLNDPDLTLKDLSELADLIPDNAIEDRSRGTVDWARTLSFQVSLIAGLAGIRLPAPYVSDGVWLVWTLRNARIRAKLWREVSTGASATEDVQTLPTQDSNFVLSGDISSRSNVPGEERTIYATYEVSGKFAPEFVYSALLNWFSEPSAIGAEKESNPPGAADEPFNNQPTYDDGLDIRISPEETRDIHELVRSRFIASRDRGYCVERVALTLEQMGRLRGDWDGKGTPPPSLETIEFAASLSKNLCKAADAVGKSVGRPWTYLLPVSRPHDGSPDAIVAVGSLLGMGLLEIHVRTGPDHFVASAALDFSPPSQGENDRGWLLVDVRVMANCGLSPADTLREVLW